MSWSAMGGAKRISAALATGVHPRLYFDAAELEALRNSRCGHQALIWQNLLHDARRCLDLETSTEWIAPEATDPGYENLYDRFFAMMSDAAIVEHLAFTAAYGDDSTIAHHASARLLAACSRWRAEAQLPPDYGTAYGTTRILKAVAVGYDLLYPWLDDAQRTDIRDLLGSGAARLAAEWFSRPEVRGPVGVAPGLHSPHHSSVEWSAFGIIGLSLLGELPSAAAWVDETIRHFADHLLPAALAPDGSAPEGTGFWASTVLSQLQFLDPLRRGTGNDLLGPVALAADTSLGLAAFRPARECASSGEPCYGDSTGMSALLFCLARERRDGGLQRVAMTEATTGRLEVLPARTPDRGEQLRVSPGGYAYAWYDRGLAPSAYPATRAWHFPQAGEAYLRTGWQPSDVSVAVVHGKGTVFRGPHLVFEDLTPRRLVDVERSVSAGTGIYRFDPPEAASRVGHIAGRDGEAQIVCVDGAGATVATIVLETRGRVRIDRCDGHCRTWAFDPAAGLHITLRCGAVQATEIDGYRLDRRVGYGLLELVDTDPRAYPTMAVCPTAGAIALTLEPVD